MSCQYADRDGAYLLGALTPSERLEFEHHLSRCEECARSVRQLAGLPGLLARVDPSVIDEPPDTEPVPPGVLPALVAETRKAQRRRGLLTAVAAAAATAAVVIPLSLLVPFGREAPVGSPTSPSSAPLAGLDMRPLHNAPVT